MFALNWAGMCAVLARQRTALRWTLRHHHQELQLSLALSFAVKYTIVTGSIVGRLRLSSRNSSNGSRFKLRVLVDRQPGNSRSWLDLVRASYVFTATETKNTTDSASDIV
jgi:hypothetical protein